MAEKEKSWVGEFLDDVEKGKTQLDNKTVTDEKKTIVDEKKTIVDEKKTDNDVGEIKDTEAKVIKADKQKKSLSQKEGKETSIQKNRTVKLFLDGKLDQYDIDEKLPEGFLMSKLKDDQRYIPIHLYREIMRQIGEYGVPEFSDPEKFLSGKNKSNVDMVTYRVKCRVVRNKPGMKEPVILTGVGYSSMSAGVLLSDAVHGNIATLEAKSLRSALKHSYRIFEFPELDVVDTNEQGQINELKAKEIIAKVATDTPAVEGKSETKSGNSAIKDDIAQEYGKKKEVVFAQLAEIKTPVEKKHILSIAKELKDKFGEEYKDLISKIILNDFNSAK